MSGNAAPNGAHKTARITAQARVQSSRPRYATRNHASISFASQNQAVRTTLTFGAINRRGSPHYDPALQRHHLLPKQLLGKKYFRAMFDSIGRKRVGFDDFRFNGLLLPSTEQATYLTGLPLHRGPHPVYNQLVIERVGTIEGRWDKVRRTNLHAANDEALGRIRLLQRALRIRLLTEKKGFVLNRKDPVGTGFNFDKLDAMAEELWSST